MEAEEVEAEAEEVEAEAEVEAAEAKAEVEAEAAEAAELEAETEAGAEAEAEGKVGDSAAGRKEANKYGNRPAGRSPNPDCRPGGTGGGKADCPLPRCAAAVLAGAAVVVGRPSAP